MFTKKQIFDGITSGGPLLNSTNLVNTILDKPVNTKCLLLSSVKQSESASSNHTKSLSIVHAHSASTLSCSTKTA